MFLSRRSTQAEYSDDLALPAAVVARNYRELARINRLFHFADPFQRILAGWLGHDQVKSLSILDLGAGDGSLGRTLEKWSAKRGWQWRVTNLDFNPLALHLNPAGRNVTGSVLALPFADNSFDVVIASQMTHHLTDPQTEQHFREAWRVTRDALLLNDLHRNAALLAIVWLSIHAAGLSRDMRADGLISVLRGWRVPEWQTLAAAAGIPDARVWLYYGSRVMLQARKANR